MANTIIKNASIDDARYIGSHLRLEDSNEIRASRRNVNHVILVVETFQESIFSKTVYYNEKPAVIYGVCPTPYDGVGAIWMLATEDIKMFSRAFILGCKREVENMQTLYPKLYNFVHKDNTVSQRWLEWLGFTIDRDVVCMNKDFIFFYRNNHV